MYSWMPKKWHWYGVDSNQLGVGPEIYDTIFLKSGLGYTPVWLEDTTIGGKGDTAYWTLAHPSLLGLQREALLDGLIHLTRTVQAPYWTSVDRDEYFTYYRRIPTGDKELITWLDEGLRHAASVEDLLKINPGLSSIKTVIYNQAGDVIKDAPWLEIRATNALDYWILKAKEFFRKEHRGIPDIVFSMEKRAFRLPTLTHPSTIYELGAGLDEQDYVIIRYKTALGKKYVTGAVNTNTATSANIKDSCILKKATAIDLIMDYLGTGCFVPGCFVPSFFSLERFSPEKYRWVVLVEHKVSSGLTNKSFLCRRPGNSPQKARVAKDISSAYHYAAKQAAEKDVETILKTMPDVIVAAEVVEDTEYTEKLKKEGFI